LSKTIQSSFSLARPYNNKNLFSNYFIETKLPKSKEWSQQEHKKAFTRIKEIFGDIKRIENLSEAQLEEHLFKKVFEILEFAFEVQADIGTRVDYPDYALFGNKANINEASRGKLSFYDGALAIGEVKKWDRELDKPGKDRYTKGSNPSFQIWLYISKTNVNWGILTNGRKWRLYHKGPRLDSYYEVDLFSLIDRGDIDGFKYFYYFFRKNAFESGLGEQSFLERMISGSEEYARKVGENLNENVYNSMRILSQGFFDNPDNHLDINNHEHLRLVQENTMRLLYRILFIFYAEGKGLLSEKNYLDSDYSLYGLKHIIAKKKDSKQVILPNLSSYWSRLNELFMLINKGSEALAIERESFFVPAYNGGLFDPDKNRFLVRNKVGDKAIADAIDLLARASTEDGKLGFVDYSTLEIRHLGSIYEGLLEYQLQVANELMVATGDGLKWISYASYCEGKKKPKSIEDFKESEKAIEGKLYIATTSGERKTTGSYYTPEYIVDNIVKSAIGPLVEDRFSIAESGGQSLRASILSIHVIDPAMGSGHFLVGAIEYLAAQLMLAIQRDYETNLLDESEYEKYSLDWAKREVVSHCIYGVDLNEMAVELAKVSLWLTTISKDKPLSFLDHRLKCGNSLIGANIQNIAWLPGQAPTDRVKTLEAHEGYIKKISEQIKILQDIPDNSIDDVKRKEQIFDSLKKSDTYRRIFSAANVHIGVSFGDFDFSTIKKGYMDFIVEAFFGDETKWQEKYRTTLVQKALKLSEDVKPFHWELEFPEIFLSKEKGGEGGFDAVIGNPPYVRIHGIKSPSVKRYLKENYSTTWMNFDLYVPFVEKGLRLLSENGRFGYILPSKFIYTEYGSRLRNLLRTSQAIDKIIDFGHNQIFRGETTYTCILILQKKPKSAFEYFHIGLKKEPEKEISTLLENESRIPENASFSTEELDDSAWPLSSNEKQSVLNKLLKDTKPLGEVLGGTFVGVQTSLDKVFVLLKTGVMGGKISLKQEDNDELYTLESPILLDLISGEDVRRYCSPLPTRSIIFPYESSGDNVQLITETNLERDYPDTYAYLKKNEMGLRNREGGKGDTVEWYGYIYKKNLSKQRKPKIILGKIVSNLSASIDLDGRCCLLADLANGLDFYPSIESKERNGWFILGLLNSRPADFAFKLRSSKYRGGYYSATPKFIDLIPVPVFPDDIIGHFKPNSQIKEYFDLCDKAGTFDEWYKLCEGSTEIHKKAIQFQTASFLSERLFNLHTQKQNEQTAFLSWLSNWLGVSISDLDGSTKIIEYSSHTKEDLIKYIKKNKSKIAINLSSREAYETITSEYEKSKGVIDGLNARIEFTERFVNQIFYTLFNLDVNDVATIEEISEEEVKKKYLV